MRYVHEHTGVCNIANNAAYAAIVSYVQQDLQKFINYNSNDDDINSDIAYINNVLAQFAQTRNVDELIQSIKQQDTYVREYYSYIVNDLYSDYYNGEWE